MFRFLVRTILSRRETLAKDYDKWNEAANYNAGDEVVHYGVVYRAKQPVYNGLIVPGANNEQFWEKIGSTRAEEVTPPKETSSKQN